MNKWIAFRTDRYNLESAKRKFKELTGEEATQTYCTGYRWLISTTKKWKIGSKRTVR